MMIDGIPNRPLYFYQKDIIGNLMIESNLFHYFSIFSDIYIEIDEVMKKLLHHGDLCALVCFLPLRYGKYRWLMAIFDDL